MSSHIDHATVPTGIEGVSPDHPAKNRNIRILDSEACLIEGTREKLAIVGFASSTRDLAPYDDPAWDVIGLNALFRFIPRADLWADIHENWAEDNPEGVDYEGWMRGCGVPVLMNRARPQLPTSVTLPIDRMIDIGADYFTSTVAMLIAWGVYQGYKEIGLWGIDLIVGTEYEVQKACAEFWLGIAHGRGVAVRLPDQCALLKHSHRYGYEKEPAWSPLLMSDFDGRVARLTRERDQLISKLHALDGAIHAVVTRDRWLEKPEDREAWYREQHRETFSQLQVMDGALQESAHWKELATLRSRGASVALHLG